MPCAPGDTGAMNYHWYDSPTATLQATTAVDVTAGVWLAGAGAPPSGSGLLPLDGVNDPWRWHSVANGWVGPAYRVTWKAGDTVPGPAMPDGFTGGELDVFVVAAEDLIVLTPNHGSAIPSFIGIDPTLGGSVGPAFSAFGTPFGNLPVGMRADADGSGIAFLTAYEADFSGPTALPAATSLDVRPYLGPLTVGEPFEFSETTPIGSDGQLYLDLTARDVYHRADGAWTKIATLPAPS